MKRFSPFPGLEIIYSHRTDGSFRNHDSIQHFLQPTVDLPISFLKLEHEDNMMVVNKLSDQTVVGDSIISNLNEQILSFVVADCFPVILFDPEKRVFSLIHCGWKSLFKNLIALTMQQMHNTYQTHSKNVVAWIGPGICARHYLQAEKPTQLQSTPWKAVIEHQDGTYSIDLNKFIKQELKKQNVEPDSILDENECTFSNNQDFFSHRRATQEGDDDGRFLVAAWQSYE